MTVNSLAFRLFVTAVVWTAIVLPLAGFTINSLYERETQQAFDDRLKTFLYVILTESTARGGSVPDQPTNIGEALFELSESGWYWQIRPADGRGGDMLVSGSLANGRIPSPAETEATPDAEGIRWRNETGPNEQPIRVAEMLYRLGPKQDGPTYSFIVAGPLDWLDERASGFRTHLTTALAIAGLVLLAMTYFQVRFGLLPLQQIEQGLQAIRSGKTERLEGEFPTEIRPLQHELNALMQSNQEIIERARTQVGNLAHALKTPLAVITNEANDADGTFARKVVDQSRIMRDQVALYLDRARIAARAGSIGRVTDIEPVVDALHRALERIYRDRGVEVSVTVAPDCRFQGEKHDLEEMLGNLMDNACKWARKNVYLNAEYVGPGTHGEPPHVVISIEDDGPGLSAEQRSKLGRRGVRLDETKPGSGLGLSIVSELAASYRGQFRLEASDRGGLKAILTLPRPAESL
ncbi:MAG: sensor histidine kinase [Pseudomonadota bacterium]